ncbi:MAG: RHS repeat-associated core domain-containing protein [Desulfitobacteriaceae bacterium]
MSRGIPLVSEWMRPKQKSYTGTLVQPFRYAGYYYDEDTGLYYLKSRYYSPTLGRFLTKYGNSYCSRHLLKHDDLDIIIFEQIEALYKSGLLRMDNIEKNLEQRQESNKDNGKLIERLQTAVHAKKVEIKNYSKQLAKGSN